MVSEADLYEPIREYLSNQFKFKIEDNSCQSLNYHIECTSTGVFSRHIKENIPDYLEIIFSFLTSERPDLTGFVNEQGALNFITVEVKNNLIDLKDIYQAKRYADLFQAKYAFLVSSKPIPTVIKRLHQRTNILQTSVGLDNIILAQWSIKTNQIIDWYQNSPFK
jgi:hypothetical protein